MEGIAKIDRSIYGHGLESVEMFEKAREFLVKAMLGQPVEE